MEDLSPSPWLLRASKVAVIALAAAAALVVSPGAAAHAGHGHPLGCPWWATGSQCVDYVPDVHWPLTDATLGASVTVEDRVTGTDWGVPAAVSAWGTNHVQLSRLASSGGCTQVDGRIVTCVERVLRDGQQCKALGELRWNRYTPSNHFVYGVAVGNSDYVNGTCSPALNTVEKRRAIMCHELGHAIGLDHTSVFYESLRASCLATYLDNGQEYTYNQFPYLPDQTDYDLLDWTIYCGHNDGWGTPSCSPPPCGPGPCGLERMSGLDTLPSPFRGVWVETTSERLPPAAGMRIREVRTLRRVGNFEYGTITILVDE